MGCGISRAEVDSTITAVAEDLIATQVSAEPTITPTLTPVGGGKGTIAYFSNRTDNEDIYLLDVSSGKEKLIVNNPADDYNPVWSSDGSTLSFISDRDSYLGDIYLQDMETNLIVRFTENDVVENGMTWNPVEDLIAYSTGVSVYELWVKDVDGNTSNDYKNFMNTGGSFTFLTQSDYFYSGWSPDGKTFVIEYYPNICILDPGGDIATCITDNEYWDQYPSWSPDGTKILFFSERDGNTGIYIVNIYDLTETLISDSSIPSQYPTWSPDGNWIAYEAFIDCNWEIFIMKADGSNPTRLTENDYDDLGPVWQP